MSKNIKSIFYFSIIIIFFGSSIIFNRGLVKPELKIPKQKSAVNINSDFIKLFSMGQKRLISSLLWTQTMLDADLEQYKEQNLNSWLFLRFKNIMILEPRFYENYLYGGQYLSIIKDDTEGATFIYDKGLIQFPDDYLLNYNAGFHFLFEVKDLKRAKVVYQKLLTFPDILMRFPLAPKILAGIEDRNPDPNVALEVLIKAYKGLPDGHLLKETYKTAIKKRGGHIPPL